MVISSSECRWSTTKHLYRKCLHMLLDTMRVSSFNVNCMWYVNWKLVLCFLEIYRDSCCLSVCHVDMNEKRSRWTPNAFGRMCELSGKILWNACERQNRWNCQWENVMVLYFHPFIGIEGEKWCRWGFVESLSTTTWIWQVSSVGLLKGCVYFVCVVWAYSALRCLSSNGERRTGNGFNLKWKSHWRNILRNFSARTLFIWKEWAKQLIEIIIISDDLGRNSHVISIKAAPRPPSKRTTHEILFQTVAILQYYYSYKTIQ